MFSLGFLRVGETVETSKMIVGLEASPEIISPASMMKNPSEATGWLFPVMYTQCGLSRESCLISWDTLSVSSMKYHLVHPGVLARITDIEYLVPMLHTETLVNGRCPQCYQCP
jgi:hypothetical protein